MVVFERLPLTMKKFVVQQEETQTLLIATHLQTAVSQALPRRAELSEGGPPSQVKGSPCLYIFTDIDQGITF